MNLRAILVVPFILVGEHHVVGDSNFSSNQSNSRGGGGIILIDANLTLTESVFAVMHHPLMGVQSIWKIRLTPQIVVSSPIRIQTTMAGSL